MTRETEISELREVAKGDTTFYRARIGVEKALAIIDSLEAENKELHDLTTELENMIWERNRVINEKIDENKELKEKLETARKSLTEIAKEPDKHDLYGEIVKWNIEEATYALEKITGGKNESPL